MVMLVIVLLHLLFLRTRVAAFITCCAEAVDCAADIFTVTATSAFLECLILRSISAANDVREKRWSWRTTVNAGASYYIVWLPAIL